MVKHSLGIVVVGKVLLGTGWGRINEVTVNYLR